jgi:hypothetical protein
MFGAWICDESQPERSRRSRFLNWIDRKFMTRGDDEEDSDESTRDRTHR